MKFYHSLILFLVTGTCTVAYSQPGNQDTAQLHRKFPDAKLIEVSRETVLQITRKGDKLRLSRRIYKLDYIQTAQAGNYKDESIEYSDSFEHISDINASTYVPTGNGYDKVKAGDIKVSNATSAGIFDDDQEEYQIEYSGLRKGAFKELFYNESYSDPHHISRYIIGGTSPTIHTKYTVEVGKGIEIGYSIQGNPKGVHFTQEAKSGKTIYTWESANLPAIEFESGAPNILYFVTHVIVYVKSYEYKGHQKAVLSSASDLYHWYNNYIPTIPEKDNAYLHHVADSLTKSLKTDEQKAKAIFYYVQDNVHYVAFEGGLNGVVPRQPALVCNRKFGDCKDMAFLTSQLMKYAGLNATVAWIGTRDIPYRYKDIATPSMVNHMIAVLDLNGKRYYIDATGSEIPFGYPTEMIQGKEALIKRGDTFEIDVVPPVPPTQTVERQKLSMSIDGSDVSVSGHRFLSGFLKINSILSHQSKDPEILATKFISETSLGNNKSAISEVKVIGATDKDSSLEYNFRCRISDYLVRNDKEIYLNMFLNKPLSEGFIDTLTHRLPTEIDYEFTEEYENSLDIPPGFKATFIPRNVNIDNDIYSLNISYLQTGKELRMSQKLLLKVLMLNRADYQQWNKLVVALNQAYKQNIVLSRAE